MRTCPCIIAIALAALSAGAAPARPIDFVRDIQPILRESCVECHNATKHKANLRLDNRGDAFTGGDGGKPIIPGNSKASPLVERILGQGDDDPMPFKKPALPKEKTDLLIAWIDQGAPWPAEADGVVEKTVTHWAYVMPERPALPAIKDPHHAAWVRNPIDAFVVARLEKEGLEPSREASREVLIRRVTLDLIGLPPTPAEVAAFVDDKSPDAYDKVVDRLLASPHYGERWASRWLDLARYADSNGYEKDRPRSMWPWRDWVINALNTDMPFDRFTIEQVGGDLLPNPTQDQLIATGFHRNTMLNEEGGVDPEEYRYYAMIDRVNTTATVWLGTTLNCAQCHNHKYDPFTQKDYYQLLAFFNSTAEETSKGGGTDPHDVSAKIPVPSPEVKKIEQQVAELEIKLKTVTPELAAAQERWEKQVSPTTRPTTTTAAQPVRIAGLPANISAIVAIRASERTAKQKAQLTSYFLSISPQLKGVRDQIAELKKRTAKVPQTALVMKELDQPRESFIHSRGAFLSPTDKVEPGIPALFARMDHGATTQPSGKLQNRLDLARWLVSPENPLTARVTVNRLWEQYFGKGIVLTSEDFGTQGEPPSHPELLDWLATQFVTDHWSMKAIHRLIVTSATYRQCSDVTPALVERDPGNRLLARGPRFRLPSEAVRDQALAIAGLLSPKVGGPSVFPPQPEGIWNVVYSGERWTTSQGEDRYRRAVYTFLRRSAPYPSFVAFDGTTREAICTRRSRTNTPLQALTTLNDPVFVQAAAAMARRVVRETGPTDAERATYAWRLCVARTPGAGEVARVVALYRQELAHYQGDAKAAQTLAASGLDSGSEAKAPELAAWTVVSNVLMNLDETLTKE